MPEKKADPIKRKAAHADMAAALHEQGGKMRTHKSETRKNEVDMLVTFAFSADGVPAATEAPPMDIVRDAIASHHCTYRAMRTSRAVDGITVYVEGLRSQSDTDALREPQAQEEEA
jgi:hypothetical protein